jgi:hypothetical protein
VDRIVVDTSSRLRLHRHWLRIPQHDPVTAVVVAT